MDDKPLCSTQEATQGVMLRCGRFKYTCVWRAHLHARGQAGYSVDQINWNSCCHNQWSDVY